MPIIIIKKALRINVNSIKNIIFIKGDLKSTEIRETSEAIAVIGTIRNNTLLTKSITGKAYKRLRYQIRTNSVIKLIKHLTTRTDSGEQPCFKHM